MNKSSEWSNVGGGESSFTTKVDFNQFELEEKGTFLVVDGSNPTDSRILMSSDGNKIFVGIPKTAVSGFSSAGSVRIFKKYLSTYIEDQVIEMPMDDITNNCNFGGTLSISSDNQYILISASGYNSSTGRLYCYKYDDINETYVLYSTIDSNNPVSNSTFGDYQDINHDGSYIVVSEKYLNRVLVYYNDGSTFSYSRTITFDASTNNLNRIPKFTLGNNFITMVPSGVITFSRLALVDASTGTSIYKANGSSNINGLSPYDPRSDYLSTNSVNNNFVISLNGNEGSAGTVEGYYVDGKITNKNKLTADPNIQNSNLGKYSTLSNDGKVLYCSRTGSAGTYTKGYVEKFTISTDGSIVRNSPTLRIIPTLSTISKVLDNSCSSDGRVLAISGRDGGNTKLWITYYESI